MVFLLLTQYCIFAMIESSAHRWGGSGSLFQADKIAEIYYRGDRICFR